MSGDKDKRASKRRNPEARKLRDPRFRMKVVRSLKRYTRKGRVKKDDSEPVDGD